MKGKTAIITYALFAIAFITVFYLLIGTGLHGDDHSEIEYMLGDDLWSFLNPDPNHLQSMTYNLTSFYLFFWAYPLLGYDYQWVYDLIKIFSHLGSIYLIYMFANDYLPRDRALLASVIFVFYPLHDATTYNYMMAPYILTPATLLYSHCLIRKNRILSGLPILMLGTFASYSSPPYVFGLAAIFAFERKFKKAVIFTVPGLLYVIFYFWIKLSYSEVQIRINPDLSVMGFLKQLIMQPLSFIEAAVGPTYWFKIFYSIGSISLISALICTTFIAFSFTRAPSFSRNPILPRSLFFGLICVLLLSFGMFALTGRYSHSAFNLGNRTTIYGSLLIAFFLVTLLPMNKKSIIFLSLIFLLPVFGLSDYWKSWNKHQKGVIENIHTNQDLTKLTPDSTLLVTGNIYSKLGPFSHIELFSMPWVVNTIFNDNVKSREIVALTPYVYLKDNSLVELKFGDEHHLGNKIYAYDSEENFTSEITVADIPSLLAQRPKEIRHWVQFMEGTWIQDIIIWISPRLSYLFQ